MRILILSSYFRPDVASTGVIMAKLADEFVAMGHEVTVVTSVPHYDKNKVWPEYSRKMMYTEQRGSMTIYRLFTYIAEDKANVLKRLLAYASFHLLSFLRAITLRKHDVILVPSPPLSNGVVADLIGRLRGTQFVYNVQDIWPDVAVRAEILKNNRIISSLQKMERYVYRRAAKLIVISEGFRKNLQEKGVQDRKISVIPIFVDTDFVTPLARDNEFSRRHGLSRNFVVLFAGNMGFSQGLDLVMDAAKLLQRQPEIEFLMVGNGAAKSKTQEYCERLQLRNVRFLPFQAHEQVPEMYAASDVCLIPLKRGFTSESVPCKLFTIMASGRPAIAAVDRDSDTWKLVHEANCGVGIEPANPEALAGAIVYYYENSAARLAAGKNGRRFVQEHFHAHSIAESYIDALSSVVHADTSVSAQQRLQATESD